jgi:hypothetical protein
MKKIITAVALLFLVNGTIAAQDSAIVPTKISRADIGGDIFSRETMIETTHEDGPMASMSLCTSSPAV